MVRILQSEAKLGRLYLVLGYILALDKTERRPHISRDIGVGVVEVAVLVKVDPNKVLGGSH